MRIRSLLLVVLAVLLLAACGGDDAGSGSNGSTDGDSSAGAGALDHVDGLISIQDDGLLVRPVEGGPPSAFRIGPSVNVAEARAIEASGAPARVSFRADEVPPVAAAVTAAPKVDEGLETFEGLVVSVSADELVVDGDGGERTFDVSDADVDVFDVHHLEEHAEAGEPVKVYFDPAAPGVGIAYEDA